jgi:CHAT domain-containing protein/tetratricopeptide (TPR) repeat protein
LTRPFDKHLDSNELDGLVSSYASSVADSGRLSEQALGEARSHVESCQDCSRMVQMHKSVQGEILRMSESSSVPPGPDCVADSEWVEVVAGLLPETKSRELMKHAARCGHCGPLLKNAAETLADEVTPEEETVLASLSSARPEWRRNLAAALHGSGEERQQKTSWWRAIFAWPNPAYGIAVIAAVATIVSIGLRTLRPPSAEQLLAQAYSEHRTLEVRIPGAKYAPMQAERGTGQSDFDKPQSLLKAKALIAENLSKNPNDPAWLQARARADLLDGNYDAAIKSLQRALEAQPDSPGLLTDLGSAYFVRAESADRPIDYGNAIESLGKALAKAPDDPVALFNRALACERMFLYTQAVDDWEHYLRVDPQGQWSDDARARLSAVQEKLKQHEKSQTEPLLTPEEFVQASVDDTNVRAKIDERVEEYLHIAITDWLPKAFPSSSSRPSPDALAALSGLAESTSDKHEDTWLTDLLRGPKGRRFAVGIQALAAALQAIDRGDYSSARNSAHRATQSFNAAGNQAGELRAKAEEVYSDHLLWEGPNCLLLLRDLDHQLELKSYTWIKAQMRLEKSNCSNIAGDLGTYQSAIVDGMKEAETHSYTALYLRALGFQSLSDSSLGNANKALSSASKGLGLFWSSQIDLMKGYNFYTDLDAAADGLHLPNFQVAISREATALLDRHPNVLLRAMAHRWYGNAAYLANATSLAASEFSKASALFAASPQTAATTRDRMNAELWLTQIEIRQGDLKRAAERLQEIKPLLDAAPSFALETEFYTAQADLAMRTADYAIGDSAVRSAIFLSEWALHSYPREADRRKWAEHTQNAYRDAVEIKLRQGDANLGLELWEWYRGAELRANDVTTQLSRAHVGLENPPDASTPPPLPAPTAVANELSHLHDRTVIVYATFTDGIAVWTYDDRGIFERWISTSLPPVQNAALHLQRLCSDPNSDSAALREVATSLYAILVAPVEGRLVPGRTIVFEPDDTLARVPWDVLIDSNAHYLFERAPIVVSPSLYRAMRLRPDASITPDTPALVVDVSAAPADSLAKLTDADDEAEVVADKFVSTRTLQGANATLSAIRREILGAVVFHFAGHAIALPQRSGLALAEIDPETQHSRLIVAGSFPSGETEHLQLAVLSACHTLGDDQADTSGTESLTESLLHAGVPHIVASRWNVDSRETSEFMKQFYTYLLSGSSVANALRTARLALASQPTSAHPYYWSAFELRGAR